MAENKINSSTLVPIGLVVLFVGGVFYTGYFTGTYDTRMKAAELSIEKINDDMKSMPSRTEFNDLKAYMTDIKNSIDKLTETLNKHMQQK